jgi:hypothetical protein
MGHLLRCHEEVIEKITLWLTARVPRKNQLERRKFQCDCVQGATPSARSGILFLRSGFSHASPKMSTLTLDS